MSETYNFEAILEGIRRINRIGPDEFLALHTPVFQGSEREYVLATIESTFVSSVGAFVNQFEEMMGQITGTKRAVACVNGTAALEVALSLAGINRGDLVLTQAISFVATANAVRHAGAEPVFLDIDADTLGLSPDALLDFLQTQAEKTTQGLRHRQSGRRLAACLPMHTFGLPCRLEEIIGICHDWDLPLVEDAAEALGSCYQGKPCGSFGLLSCFSFNGNKICTTGGGGAIVTNDEEFGKRAKHLTTTAKQPHPWKFFHDHTAWNFRMPNINAALGCAQLERLPEFLNDKRKLHSDYQKLFSDSPWQVVDELSGCQSNYWLNAVLLSNKEERDAFLAYSNARQVQIRPVWEPMPTLPMYENSLCGPLDNALAVADKLVNIPSGVRA
ncbi:MAG: LegC family aminotransferase [Deltaproteobacteria bacterium]|jgi:aminotransferase in exopolysaccharide biosynthesis|nr:LegC family aminotransferase [Deltaproteobacteria bacterium]